MTSSQYSASINRLCFAFQSRRRKFPLDDTVKSSEFNDMRPVAEPIQVSQVKPPKDLQEKVIRADIQDDNLRIGKSCRYDEDHWDCRDCGLTGTLPHWENCTTLSRRNTCPEFPRPLDWDFPRPRSYSFLDPTASHHATRHILSWYDLEPLYEQVSCNMDDNFCFDLSRCSVNGPMTVYAHPTFGNVSQEPNFGEQQVSRAAERFPDKIQQVTDPSLACLLVVTCDAYHNYTDLVTSKIWNEGRNHFVFQSNHCFDAHPDRTFQTFHYGKAALATSALTDASLRKGYDIPLAQVRGTLYNPLLKEFAVSRELRTRSVRTSQQQQRKWLLGYKGRIAAYWPHPWWHHRYLAYEYWNTTTDPDVAIDAICWGRTIQYKGSKEYTAGYDYNDLLANATFAFCPGGASVNSYRFSEALLLGSIPVVTPEFVPPFHPEVDWSSCLFQVSESRIVDLPRLLREIPPENVQERRKKCLALFEKTIGWVLEGEDQLRVDSGATAFLASMELWAWRVRKAHESQRLRRELETELLL